MHVQQRISKLNEHVRPSVNESAGARTEIHFSRGYKRATRAVYFVFSLTHECTRTKTNRGAYATIPSSSSSFAALFLSSEQGERRKVLKIPI